MNSQNLYDIDRRGGDPALDPGVRRLRRSRRRDIVLTVAGLLGVAALAFVGLVYGLFLSMSVTGCSVEGPCLATVTLVATTAAFVPGIIFLIVVFVAILRLSTGHTASIVAPLGAICITVTLLLVRALQGALGM